MTQFREIKVEEIEQNTFKLIGKDWMLVTAEHNNEINTMTASWGGLGVLWNKNVAYLFIRPQRYTYEFVQNSENLTLSFFTDEYRNVLNSCGKHSGREYDKIKENNLTVVKSDNGVYFEEAKLVLKCKKIYRDSIKPENFIDKSIDNFYDNKDYHIMYIVEINKVLIKD